MKNATLRDVATLAGVSIGTVSKYINGKPVKQGNQEKIQSAIRTLHFIPNPLARSFASNKSYMILLYLIVESPIADSTWQHELPIIHGITTAFKGTKYSLKIEIAIVTDVEENAAKLDGYTRSRYTDGIILLSPWEIQDRLILPLEYYNIPHVMIGRSSTVRETAYVDFDNEQPIYDIVMDMYAHGCRRFGMINGLRTQRHTICRERGFTRALKELGIPADPELIRFGDYSLKSGHDLAMELLKRSDRPDALVCGNDYIAAGAIRAVHELGLRIPEDVLVSGFDNTVVSEATNPVITTVKAPAYEIGMIAGRELLTRLDNPDYEIPGHLLQCEVIYRASTHRDAGAERPDGRSGTAAS